MELQVLKILARTSRSQLLRVARRLPRKLIVLLADHVPMLRDGLSSAAYSYFSLLLLTCTLLLHIYEELLSSFISLSESFIQKLRTLFLAESQFFTAYI